MAVSVLLLTHHPVGDALLEAARHVLGPVPLRTLSVGVRAGDEPEAVLRRASRLVIDADEGAGVLVLTDLYGATPSNLGARLEQLGVAVRRVSGLSLPMLLRVFNYADQPLDELAAIAVAGGRQGIVGGHA